MSFLQKIEGIKQQEIADRKAVVSLDEIKQQCAARDRASASGFIESLKKVQTLAVIAEVKGSSPSQGVIQEAFDPVEVATGYESSGACAISILTDQSYFNGHADFLKAIAKQVQIPCLQKDFVIDPYQIYEGKLLGASALLLIVRMLSLQQFQNLHGLADELGLDVLVEVHDQDELVLIESCKNVRLLGINNRNLDDLSVDIKRCLVLKKHVPFEDVVLVAESGLETSEDLHRMRDAGFDAVLMGTSLMRTGEPAKRLKELMNEL